MAVKEKLTKQVKQLSAREIELQNEVIDGKEAIRSLENKLKAAEKRAEDVAYEQDGLQARLQQCQDWTRWLKAFLASIIRCIGST